MRYIDKYPNCIGCPVEKYCGTMVSSIKLCNSYTYKEEAVSTPQMANVSMVAVSAKDITPKDALDDYAIEQITLQQEIM